MPHHKQGAIGKRGRLLLGGQGAHKRLIWLASHD
jgi:hypothetical protein